MRIKFLFEQGKSQTKIAREVNFSQCAVQYMLNRNRENGSYQNKPRTGRKRITTVREDRNLIRQSLRNRKKSSEELAAAFSQATTKF